MNDMKTKFSERRIHIGSKHLNQTNFHRHEHIFQPNTQQNSFPYSNEAVTSRYNQNYDSVMKSSGYSQSNGIQLADTMSDQVRHRKSEVQQWKKSHHSDDKSWKKSTKPAEQPSKQYMENHVFDRSKNFQYNYRAETLDVLKNIPPIDKSTKFHLSTQTLTETKKLQDLRKSNMIFQGSQRRTEEMPVHPNLEHCPAWNSTTSVEVKSMEKLSQEKGKRAQEWTKTRNNLLGSIQHFNTTASSSTAGSGKGYRIPYVSPIETQTQLLESIRAMKREKRFDNTQQIGRLARTATDNVINGVPHGHEDHIEDPKRSGVWAFNVKSKSYIWSDDASLRPVVSSTEIYLRKNSVATDLHTISTGYDSYLR